MNDDLVLRVADLPQNSATRFDLRPGNEVLKALCAELDLLGLRKLSFSGDLAASGTRDWELNATLGATVVQPCTVTLDPVTTRIDVPVRRLFLADWHEPQEAEIEMQVDDDSEALGAEIDVTRVMTEALALALPLYPRKQDADLEQVNFTEPGKTAMTDEDAKPFAGLANLRDALNKER